MRNLEPLIVLFLLPVTIGVACELWLRDVRHATLAATGACTLAIYACLGLLDPEGTWTWLATLLVLPLPLAFALAAVLICYGRAEARRRRRRHAH